MYMVSADETFFFRAATLTKPNEAQSEVHTATGKKKASRPARARGSQAGGKGGGQASRSQPMQPVPEARLNLQGRSTTNPGVAKELSGAPKARAESQHRRTKWTHGTGIEETARALEVQCSAQRGQSPSRDTGGIETHNDHTEESEGGVKGRRGAGPPAPSPPNQRRQPPRPGRWRGWLPGGS